MIDKKPFVNYKTEDEKDGSLTLTIRLSEREQRWLIEAKSFIKQPKTSTAIKQLARIGAVVVLHDKKINKILELIIDNKRKNERIGATEKEIKTL
jgi:hypothetical protein